MDKVEFVASTNSDILDSIKFADVKAGALLTLSSLIAAGLGRFSDSLFDVLKDQDSCWYWFTIIVIIFVGVSLLVTLCKTLSALRPNLNKAENSLRSFPDIAARSCEDYIQSSKKLNSEEKIVSDFCAHNWTLSRIANAKFQALQRAFSWLRAAIVAVFFLFGLYFILKLQM